MQRGEWNDISGDEQWRGYWDIANAAIASVKANDAYSQAVNLASWKGDRRETMAAIQPLWDRVVEARKTLEAMVASVNGYERSLDAKPE